MGSYVSADDIFTAAYHVVILLSNSIRQQHDHINMSFNVVNADCNGILRGRVDE
jgi:hypothetical protein